MTQELVDAGVDPSPVIGRLSAQFVLDFLVGLPTASHGDFIDGVISIAILDANVRHLISDANTSRRYSSFELPIPDDLRRPASINAIAGSLGLPFETARRRIRALAASDLCLLSSDGVILSGNHLATPEVEAFMKQTFSGLTRFHGDLRRLAPSLHLVELDAGEPATRVDEPVRLAARSAIGYVLRYLESAKPVAGELLNAILYLAISVANVEHITRTQALSDQWAAPRTVVPDDQRRRVTVLALSKRLGMSFETTRRRVNALIDMGACVRDSEGIYASAERLVSDAMVTHRRTNAASLQRLFMGLARLGVVFDDPPQEA